jgi:hypothetical protein
VQSGSGGPGLKVSDPVPEDPGYGRKAEAFFASWRRAGRPGILETMRLIPAVVLDPRGLLAAIVIGGIATLASAFDGWQGMRVIQLDGRAARLLVADLGADGRDDIVVVNPRQARLDVYRWLPPDERTRADEADPERPNELPLAADWSRGEIAIDELPLDAVAHDIDDDGRPELLVLTSPSNRVTIYKQAEGQAIDARGAWQKAGGWNLLAGKPTGRRGSLLVRDLPDGKHELLVSCEEGIQRLPLESSGRAEWLAPRESRGRIDWRLADLDNDGDQDLVEWTSVARQVIRWHPCDSAGRLLPAQTLHDRPIDGFETAAGPTGPADLLLLGGSDKGVVRQYRLVRGEATDVGRQDALPMGSLGRRGWAGITLGGEPAIVAADADQPRLRVHRITPAGWSTEETFPAVGGIKALAAPRAAADEGLLLVWAKDAADLHRCRWENGRLGYPQPWVAEGKDRKILALDAVGGTVWWAQRVGSDVDLFVWPADAAEPTKTRFAGLGPKVEKVVWLDDDTLLVQDAYASAAKLVRLAEGKPVVTTPALLVKADLDEYRLLEVAGSRRRGRLTNGVLQWLGPDLHPLDQVMLGDGQRIASYLPLPDEPGQAWALEQGGSFLHRLAADDAGVMRPVETVKPPTGTTLESDPVLGVVLLDKERIVRLSRGEPWELELVDTIDGRIGRRSGVSESTIHRILVTDIDGDGGEDVLLCDDRRHQLTAMLRKPAADGGPARLERSVTWKVFEDRKYPYDGGDSKNLVSEPVAVAGLDADADGARDLAIVSQDRLIIYLGGDSASDSGSDVRENRP